MPTSMRIVPRGLVTDPSRLVAGDGGLVDAQNVVFRSEGLIEPRAALSFVGNEAVYGLAGFGIDTVPLHSREWDSDTVTAFGSTDDDYLISIARETDAFPLITMGGEYNTAEVRVFSELADGRCIWTFPNGLRCLDQSDQEPSDNVEVGHGAFMRMPGAARVAPYYVGYNAGGSGFLGVNETTAYRFTIVRWIETENRTRVPIEGAPSDRYVVQNRGATAANVTIGIDLSGMVRSGDELRIYRTPTEGTAGGDPGDEMILRYSQVCTGPNELIAFDDYAAADEFGGPALYTNSSQQGGTRANYRLRTSRDLALYQGKLFYGGGDAGWRQSTTVKRVGPVVDSDKSETLLSVRSTGTTVDWIDESPIITGVQAGVFPYLSIGQLVTGYDAGIPNAAPTSPNAVGLYGFIVGFDSGAGTITLDRDATATQTNLDIVAWDWIAWTDENETSYRVYAPYVTVGSSTLNDPDGSTSAQGGSLGVMRVQPTTVDNIDFGTVEQVFIDQYNDSMTTEWAPIARMYSQTGADPNIGITVTVEYDGSYGNMPIVASPDTMSFYALPRIAITSSKPAAFTTPVGRTYAESHPANRDSVATLWWSKINQPESVPLGNFAIVGDASQPISRIFATIDRLWILKPDGLYCAYGSGDTEDSITIQLVDGTFRMIDSAILSSQDATVARCSTWAAKVKDTVFAWGRNGIVAIGSGGVQRIDSAIETDIRSFTPSYSSTQAQTTLGTPFCAGSERESIVVFGTSGQTYGEGDFIPGRCYVYHVETGMWATWEALPISVSAEGAVPRYTLPTLCGGYGASTDGMMRIPARSGFMRYLDVPANNSASMASTVFSDDVYPVTGDREDAGGWSNTIDSAATDDNGVATVVWSQAGPALIPGARFKDSEGDWFWTISTDWDSLTSVVSDEPEIGPLGDCHYAVNRVVTFSANQPPFTEKHFLSCWAHFQMIRAGTQFTTQWRARGHVAGEAPTLTVVYDPPASSNWPRLRLENDLEYDKAISIPTEVGRSRGVEMTITDAQADVYFAMDGLTMQYEAETVRIEGRR